MAASNRQIRSLDSLDQDIRILQKKAKGLEKQIDESFDYLQEHSGSMFINSLLPRKKKEEMHAEGFSLGGTILYTLLQNEQLRKNLGKLSGHLAEKLGDGLNRLISRLFRE